MSICGAVISSPGEGVRGPAARTLIMIMMIIIITNNNENTNTTNTNINKGRDHSASPPASGPPVGARVWEIPLK